MYDAIDLIEQFGTEPVLASAGGIADRAAAAGAAPETIAAFVAGDAPRLAQLLRARTDIVCAIATPEPETPKRDDGPEPEPQKTPDDDKPDAPRPTG